MTTKTKIPAVLLLPQAPNVSNKLDLERYVRQLHKSLEEWYRVARMDIGDTIENVTNIDNSVTNINNSVTVIEGDIVTLYGSLVFEATENVIRPIEDHLYKNFIIGSPTKDYTEGYENRMFFDLFKGVFRAGYDDAGNWDAANNGYYSFGAGRNPKVSGYCAIGIGENIEASNQYSIGLGGNIRASEQGAIGIGENIEALASYVLGSGCEAKAYLSGQFARAIGSFSEIGDAQYSNLISRITTDNATPKSLFNDVIPAKTNWAFRVTVIGRGQATNDSKTMEFKGLIARDDSNNTALYGNIYKNKLSETPGASAWDADVSADDTNESLKIEVTGQAGLTIRWVSFIELVEVAGSDGADPTAGHTVVNVDLHEHSNKALLDTYTQLESDLADAVSKKHAHSNKTILDLIEEAFTTSLKNNYDTAYGWGNHAAASYLKADGTVPLSANWNADGANTLFIDKSNGRIGIGTATTVKQLTLSKDIELPDTTASNLGVIYKNGTRFLHNFHHPTGQTAIPVGNNVFIGEEAGNFTMGSTATATYQASRNIGIGYIVLKNCTTGYYNMGVGGAALAAVNSGAYNVGIGYASLGGITTTNYNIGIGDNAGYKLADNSVNATPTYCIYIGSGAKGSTASRLNEIVIGYSAIGEGSNTIRLGNTSITDLFTAAVINAGGYKASDGSAGITQTVAILDGDGVTTHTLTFKNGLLTAYAAA